MFKAPEHATIAASERSKQWMIALRTASKVFPRGKGCLTAAALVPVAVENPAERQGTWHSRALARQTGTECGKTLAEGP